MFQAGNQRKQQQNVIIQKKDKENGVGRLKMDIERPDVR